MIQKLEQVQALQVNEWTSVLQKSVHHVWYDKATIWCMMLIGCGSISNSMNFSISAHGSAFH